MAMQFHFNKLSNPPEWHSTLSVTIAILREKHSLTRYAWLSIYVSAETLCILLQACLRTTQAIADTINAEPQLQDRHGPQPFAVVITGGGVVQEFLKDTFIQKSFGCKFAVAKERSENVKMFTAHPGADRGRKAPLGPIDNFVGNKITESFLEYDLETATLGFTVA
jgi:hypothetical protein